MSAMSCRSRFSVLRLNRLRGGSFGACGNSIEYSPMPPMVVPVGSGGGVGVGVGGVGVPTVPLQYQIMKG